VVFQDDLPSISISRFRATGVIDAETTECVIKFGDFEQTVGVKARRFPNGGSWSLFCCPSCGRNARVLRLLAGAMVCCRCCTRRGVRFRCEPMSVRQRAEHRIPKLKAMLESETSLRLKPVLWGKLERRSRHEAALERARLIVALPRFGRGGAHRLLTPETEPAAWVPKAPGIIRPGGGEMGFAAVSRVLAEHRGYFPTAGPALGLSGPELRRLVWRYPHLLDAAHEEMGLEVDLARSEWIAALSSGDARRQMWGADHLLGTNPSWWSLLAPPQKFVVRWSDSEPVAPAEPEPPSLPVWPGPGLPPPLVANLYAPPQPLPLPPVIHREAPRPAVLRRRLRGLC
jgi:hypothetical protein